MNSRHFDLIVVGAGMAGIVSAAVAIRQGLRVALVSTGPGSFVFGAGCVEADSFDSKLPFQRDSVEFFRELSAEAGCPFFGGVDEAHWIPTMLGSFQRVSMAPFYLWNGIPSAADQAAVVGIHGLSSFDADFTAERLAHAASRLGCGTTYIAREIALSTAEGTVAGTLQYANRFDRDPEFRNELLAALTPIASSASLIILPGILGVRSGQLSIEWLQKELGCLLCELPTLPPSVPGIRLYNRMEAHLRHLGVELFTGFPVRTLELRNHRCEAVVIDSPARPLRLTGDTVVAATGPFPGALLGTTRFTIDNELRPIDENGSLIASNLLAAGAILRHGSSRGGNALAIHTGYRAGLMAAHAGVQYV